MRVLPIALNPNQLAAFCRRHHVVELSLFGSILGDEFKPDSDVDVLVQFEPDHTLTLDSYVEMREELAAQLGGREIDLVELRRLADPYRRHEILRTREVVYAR